MAFLYVGDQIESFFIQRMVANATSKSYKSKELVDNDGKGCSCNISDDDGMADELSKASELTSCGKHLKDSLQAW